ncbi:MAG: tetratricopeptide repeat protein [Bryobacteraceae bacterium]
MATESSRIAEIPWAHIERLEAAGDWTGLVRCWLANRLDPSILQRALAVLNVRATQDSWYSEIARYVSGLDAASARSAVPISAELRARCNPDELLTMSLVALYPHVLTCHLAEAAHSVLRPKLLTGGLDAAKQASILARMLNDLDLAAFCCDASAHALLLLGRLQEARDAMLEAVDICRQLCSRDPETYSIRLWMALDNLAVLYERTGPVDQCCACRAESAEILAPLATTDPLTYGAELLPRLGLLGNLQFRMGHFDDACVTFERALECARRLNALDAAAYNPLYLQALYDVSCTYLEMKRLPSAHACLVEATTCLEALNESAPNVDAQVRAGKIWNGLGVVLTDMERLPEARDALRHALRIRRRLYERDGSFKDDLAMTLQNMTRIEGKLEGVQAAGLVEAELWDLEREWGGAIPRLRAEFVGAAADCPPWVVHFRKFFCLRHIADLDAAIRACPDEEIRRVLGHPAVMMGSAPESGLQDLANHLAGQRRIAEAVSLSCLSGLGELTKTYFREFEPLLRTRGVDTIGVINLVAACEAVGFHESAAYMLYSLGKYHAQRGESSRAEQLLRRAWADFQSLPQAEAREFATVSASILNSLGAVLRVLREFGEAEAVLVQAIEMRRGLLRTEISDEDEYLANALSNLAKVAGERGEVALARQSIDEALAIYRRLSSERHGIRPLEARSLTALGAVEKHEGDIHAAVESFREASAILRQLHAEEAHLAEEGLPTGAYRCDLAVSLSNWATALMECGQTGQAVKLVEESLGLFEGMQPGVQYDAALAHASVLSHYGDLLLDLGRTEAACQAYRNSVLLAETQEGSGVERYLFKGSVASAYSHILYDELCSNNEQGVFRCLAALREGDFTALATPSADDFDAAFETLAQKREGLGRQIRILIAESLPGDRVLLALMTPDKKRLECHVSRNLGPAARRLFDAVAKTLMPATEAEQTDPIRTVRDLGVEAWSVLPELIRETLSSGFAGDVLISGDAFWAEFPWEGLYDQVGGGWVGLHRPLSRWTAISAAGLRGLRRSSFGKGWPVAAVFCPWDAVSHLKLPTARTEAEQVADALRRMGYELLGGGAIVGRAATKASLFEALRKQPSVVHYAGHGDVRNDEEVLIFAEADGAGWDCCGPADFALHKDQSRIKGSLLEYGPLVVLNACYAGRVREYGGKREDLVSLLIAEGANGVVACPLQLDDMMGNLFGSSLYTPAAGTMADHFLASRCRVERLFAERDPKVWPLWMLFHYHGNPYAVLP